MQLFSIGVDALNQDGTPVLDAQGNRVPTYDQTTLPTWRECLPDGIWMRIKVSTVDGTTASAQLSGPNGPQQEPEPLRH